ncbi:hypothetical protein ACKF11_12965 [Methylobacillus sp. Pita2]|uniref:hypothetical protein n=1 Tax=Methylobacillus sp. Pita2 TaxID=3383245 RepID=UPI0038B4D78F
MFGRKIDTGIGGLFAYNPHLEKPVAQKTIETREGNSIDYWHDYALQLQDQVKGLVANRDEAVQVAIERKSNDAGLRAVVRLLLGELRKTQPNHPLLDKKNRDKVFNEFAQAELEKILASRNEQGRSWDPLRPGERQSE